MLKVQSLLKSQLVARRVNTVLPYFPGQSTLSVTRTIREEKSGQNTEGNRSAKSYLLYHLHRKTNTEIHFTHLGAKDISWIPKACCIINVSFSTK